MPEPTPADSPNARLLTALGISVGLLLLLLSFFAAWTAPESSPGAPAFGFVLSVLSFAMAALAAVARWVGREPASEPLEQRRGLARASFLFLAFAVAGLVILIAAVAVRPSSPWQRYATEDPYVLRLRAMQSLLDGTAIVVGCAAALAFLMAWVLGRIALAGKDAEALGPRDRLFASVAPYPGTLLLVSAVYLALPLTALGIIVEVRHRRDDWAGLMGTAAALAILAIEMGLTGLLVRLRPGILRGLFSPVTGRLDRHHAKGFFIAAEVAGALAAIAIAFHTSL